MGQIVSPLGNIAAGFATVDAIVALAILAGVLILGIQVSSTAIASRNRAEEMAQGTRVLSHLLQDQTKGVGTYRGRTDRYSWVLRVAQVSPVQPSLPLCRREAEIRFLRSGKPLSFVTIRTCPAQLR